MMALVALPGRQDRLPAGEIETVYSVCTGSRRREIGSPLGLVGKII